MARLGPITIGALQGVIGTAARWLFSGSDIPLLGAAGASSLFADQTTPYYLAQIRVQSTVGNQFNVRFAPNTTEVGGQHGPEFNDAWEVRGAGAFVLSLAGIDYAFSGPNAPGSTTGDATEPYSYVPAIADNTTAANFITAYNAASQAQRDAITVTFDDGVLPDAVAPTSVTLNSPGTINESTSVTLTDSVSGGTYDTLARTYQVISGGGSITAAGRYTAPSVAAAGATIRVRLTVTASGTGTLAAAGTSATRSDDVTFTVRNVPQLSTTLDTVYRLALAQPATPTGGTGEANHTPTGWLRPEPDASETQEVWQSRRTLFLTDGVFVAPASAWGTPTLRHARLLALADWTQPPDTANLVLALVQARVAGSDFVSLAANPTDLLAGEVEVADDLTLDMLERHGDNQNQLVRMRRTSGSANFSAYFGPTAVYPGAKLYIQTGYTTVWPFTHDGSGGSFSNWDADDIGAVSIINGIATGHRLIWAITRPVTEVDLAASATTGAMTASAAIEFGAPPGPLDLAGAASTGAATASAALSLVTPVFTALALSGAAATGPPTASAALDLPAFSGAALDASGSASTGAPTAAAALDLSAFSGAALELAGAATTGAPTASAAVTLAAPSVTPVEVAGSAATGLPTASAALDFAAFSGNALDISGAASTGEPTAAAALSLLMPLNLAGSASTGPATASAAMTLADPPVRLADYDQPAGTYPLVLAHLLARIDAEDFADPGGYPADLLAGELVVADDLTLTMLERHEGSLSGPLRLRRTGSGLFSFYFDDEGSPLYPSAVAQVQTATATTRFSVGSNGGSFSNWVLSSGDQATLTGLTTGTQFLFGINNPSPEMNLAGSASTGAPTASAALTLDDPAIAALELAGGADTGALTASAALSLVTPAFTPVSLAGSATTGLPTASAALDLPAPGTLELAGAATTGNLAASARLVLTSFSGSGIDLAGSASTGAPTASAALSLATPAFTPTPLAGSASTGALTAEARVGLTLAPVSPLELSASASTGGLTASAALVIHEPLDLAGSADTGALTASAALSLVTPTVTPLVLTGGGVASTGGLDASARLDLALSHPFPDPPKVPSLFEGVDVMENRRLLIQQWHETRLDDVVRARLREMQERAVEVLGYVERAGSLDMAEGVWLDHIGERLGYARPFVPATGLIWFGFDDAGASFGGAPLRSDLEALTVLAPLGDACYRDLLRARVVLLNPDGFGSGTKPLMEAAIAAGGITGTVADHQDRTATIVLTGLPMSAIMLPLWREVFRGPAGVALTITAT